MNLVFINTLNEISSIKEFLKLNMIEEPVIVNTVEDICLQSTINSDICLYVFDYKLDTNLIYNLNATYDNFKFIKVFTNNITTARQYLSVTTDIQVMPQPYNIMLLLWNHPAFSLSNLNTCGDENGVVNLKLSSITEDSATIDINTVIDETNTLNLSLVRNNIIDILESELNINDSHPKKTIKSKRKEFKNIEKKSDIEPIVKISNESPVTETTKVFSNSIRSIKTPVIDSPNKNTSLSKLRLANCNVVTTLKQYLINQLDMSAEKITQYEIDFRNNSLVTKSATLDEYLYKKHIIDEIRYTDILRNFYNKSVLNSIQLEDRIVQFKNWDRNQCIGLRFIQLQPISNENEITVAISNSKPETESIIRRKYLNATIYFTAEENISKLLEEG